VPLFASLTFSRLFYLFISSLSFHIFHGEEICPAYVKRGLISAVCSLQQGPEQRPETPKHPRFVKRLIFDENVHNIQLIMYNSRTSTTNSNSYTTIVCLYTVANLNCRSTQSTGTQTGSQQQCKIVNKLWIVIVQYLNRINREAYFRSHIRNNHFNCCTSTCCQAML